MLFSEYNVVSYGRINEIKSMKTVQCHVNKIKRL